MLLDTVALTKQWLVQVKRFFVRPLHRPQVKKPYSVLGSAYGGWPVLDDVLDADSRVYSFGVGHDISFDLAVIDTYQCEVLAFDPTPRCIEWIQLQILPKRFRFLPMGLSDKTETLRFAPPLDESHVSYTVGKGMHSEASVELPVKALDTLLQEQGDQTIDLIKMDIEGSEYVVLVDMVKKSIFPKQICVEFHHGMFGYRRAQTIEAVKLLQDAGYEIFYVSSVGREYGFCREDVSAS